jgi:Tfp pilus assembly protein PilN
MKITLNLSPAASARDRFALAWAVPATLAGVAALVFLGRTTLREYRDYQGIQVQLAEVQKHADELKDQEAAIRRKLAYPAYRDLLHRATFVNKLIDEREVSLSEISARIAGLLPEDARLTGLMLTPPRKPGDDYELRMGIIAKSEDAVDTLLNDLEDDAAFKDVSIINEGFSEEEQQVNLMCTAHYLPGVDDSLVAGSEALEAGSEKPKPRSQKVQAGTKKPEVGGKAAEAKSQESAAKPPQPPGGVHNPGRGFGHPRAQESTPNRKPIF